ncbi:MAG: aquaporin, partial [Candidatus Thermoplasmatota archaeon]|nr:aquaporin [Candidatus Thermoplasmatota archaeon]
MVNRDDNNNYLCRTVISDSFFTTGIWSRYEINIGGLKLEDVKVEPLAYNKYIAEMIGTLALVLIGCGSAVIAGDKIGFLGISFAFGLTVLAMVYAIGPISGCHINPAITIAMLAAGKINTRDAVAYIISQV